MRKIHASFKVSRFSFLSWKAGNVFLICLEFMLLLYVQINQKISELNFFMRTIDRIGDVAALLNFKSVMVIGTTLHLKSLPCTTGCAARILPVVLF